MEVPPLRQSTKENTGTRKTKRGLKLKSKITWKVINKTLLWTLKPHQRLISCSSSMKHLSKIHVHQEVPVLQLPHKKPNKHVTHPNKSLAFLLQMPYTASDFIDWGEHMTPTISPKENISTKWREIHGLFNWDGLLDPLHPWLRREIVKYGDFAQATYDAFDFDDLSEFCGSCRYNRHKLFEELGLTKHGYKVTQYIFAMSHVDVPRWLERSQIGETWSKDSNWMGFVAVSNDEESERIGRRDILVAWRGTVAPTEWFNDLKTNLDVIDREKNVKVQHGFLNIYKSKGEFTRYNKSSASEQVIEEIKRIVDAFRGEELSLTISGHSLGGALALLNAYEAATTIPNITISVISFGAPRVGNIAFNQKLNELGVKTLRVVIKQDLVPKVPGILFSKIFHKLPRLNWVYRHVGTQLKLDLLMSGYLKSDSDLVGSHNLEVYLHLLDGYVSMESKFRWNARRDLALVNKHSDMLIKELKIPEFWYQLPHKGLVLNKHGRWVKPSREPEDIPSPFGTQVSTHDHAFKIQLPSKLQDQASSFLP